jgi:hypothetical protein
VADEEDTAVVDPELHKRIVAWIAERRDPSWRKSYVETAKRFAKAARCALEMSFEKARCDLEMSFEKKIRTGTGKDTPKDLHEALQEAFARDDDDGIAWIARERLGLKLGELLPPEGTQNAETRAFMAKWRTHAGWLAANLRRIPIAKGLNTFLPPDTWSDDPEAFARLAANLRRMANWLVAAAAGPAPGPKGGRPAYPARRNLVEFARSAGINDRELARLVVGDRGLGNVFDDVADDRAPAPTDRDDNGPVWSTLPDALDAWKKRRIAALVKEFGSVGRLRLRKRKPAGRRETSPAPG